MWPAMRHFMITLLVATVMIGLSQQQTLPRCLFSRHDYMPCVYRGRRLLRARDNEYTIHYTNLGQSQSGGIQCNVRRGNVKEGTRQLRREITTVGTEDMKILFSPGFILEKNYDDQLLVEYQVKCGEDQLAFFNVTTIDMQGREDCIDENGSPKCQDYILIDRGDAGTTELCGNTTSDLSLETSEFTVTFRSSEEKNFTGFEMYVICFRAADMDLEDCTRPGNFTSSVCPASIGSNMNNTADIGPSDSQSGGSGTRMKREYAEGITYSDMFQNYPHGLKVRKDVAMFHNQWLRKKRQAIDDFRFVERIVFHNESVNYIDNTIRIADSDGIETERYENVLSLQTFDALGKITVYVGRVDSEDYPHFFGPGPLIIIDRYAYFQLFIIDPRGLIPNPAEEMELEALNEPLLDSVDASLDIALNNPNPIIEPFPFLFGDRKKRDTIDDPQSTPQRESRQAETEIPEQLLNVTNASIFVVLRNLDACNPVLRSQARTSLIFYQSNETTNQILEQLMNFTITCNSNDEETLECKVNEGFAPALDSPGATYCTFSNGNTTRTQCNPFYGGVNIARMSGNVTIESINCDGQRVVHEQALMAR